jgi:hypothetical protein
VRRLLLLVAAIGPGAGACGGGAFESASEVTDLRILGLQAEPPEVVVDIDLADPDVTQLDVPPVTLTALVVDPAAERTVTWSLVACAHQDDGFCLRDDTERILASGEAPDPEGLEALPITAVLDPDPVLLQASLDADELGGAAGIPIHIELRVAAGLESAHAHKRQAYVPRIPEDRQANRNPVMTSLRADGTATPRPRCADPAGIPLAVEAGAQVIFEPRSGAASYEQFVLPTLDGGQRSFIEVLDYAWYATGGHFSDGTTGGVDPLDPEIATSTTWTAPADPGLVTLWVVQRDGRGGMSWLERCIQVMAGQ